MKLLHEEQDLLNDSKLDEMQKAYAYKLAFKCFKALYWSNIAFTVIPLIFSGMTNKSGFHAITAILMLIVTNIIYLIFGAKMSKVGALNPAFAKYMAQPTTVVLYIIMLIIYTFVAVNHYTETGENIAIYFGIYMAITIGTYFALSFIAKKNNKVAEEDEEE